MNIIQELDFMVLNYIREHLRNGFLDNIMPLITILGNMGIFWVVVALIISAKAKYRKCSITMLVGMVIGVIIGNV
ncbi:MAG: phosphatase PAP2 family protein, partial [Ruminococcus sp.]|nr:phosphatase PAP2 family protein [Ruminococcus sp.]